MLLADSSADMYFSIPYTDLDINAAGLLSGDKDNLSF
jgi:hypothetical protein